MAETGMMTEIPTSLTLLEAITRPPGCPEREDAWRRFICLYCPLVYRLAKKRRIREIAHEISREWNGS